MLESALSYQWPDVMWSRTYIGEGVSSGPGELADWFPTFQAADGPVSIILVSDGALELFSIWREASLPHDPRFATPALREANIDELVAEVNALIADVPVAEVCATLDAFGVPVARVNTLDEVFDDEQVRHLGAIIETEHPDGGQCGSPAHRSHSAECAKPPRPFRRSTHRVSARILPLSSGNSESMAKRSLACSLVTPRTRRPCTPCSRLGRQPRLPQPTTDAAGAENVGQRGSFRAVRV